MASRRFGWVAEADSYLTHPTDTAVAGFEPLQEDGRARWELAMRPTRQRIETRHAALDFAVDRSGRWWLLDVNRTPAGSRGPVFAKGGRGGA